MTYLQIFVKLFLFLFVVFEEFLPIYSMLMGKKHSTSTCMFCHNDTNKINMSVNYCTLTYRYKIFNLMVKLLLINKNKIIIIIKLLNFRLH